ncbi:MAG: ATP-binding protein, partial [Pirellulaceae bacterium]
MQDFEKLGVFYLGKLYDPAASRLTDSPLLYESKDMTTHALCVGMTGSGKTGLCLGLLEEAAMDGIPAIAIDPKGDLGNLLLSFPELRPADFEPWVEPGEATRAGMTVPEFAAQTAARWQAGLADWGQDGERIARLRGMVDLNIYTPGSSYGLPLSLLRSFDVPPQAVLENSDALRERVLTAVSGLLGLLGIDADPLRSREHILLSNILDRAWREGRSLTMAELIREIQQPPFKSIGVIDLETVFPAADRFALSLQLNNLLASPGFAGWTEGEPLDIGRLLYTAAGKPRLSILTIAHLSDAERMFFVTMLLNELTGWMRAQAGTSSLRALLFMDEVFGYFPPTANPPSKLPMLTLLKQARAFGIGIVLATQNPVDLDYKGLANCGTWFLGRLQTERDKARVLDGLEGASTAAGQAFDRAATERILSGLGNRVFLLNNVHEDQPVVFQTRWTMSYLRGPLTRGQIERLMRPVRDQHVTTASPPTRAKAAPVRDAGAQRPMLPPGIEELFLDARQVPAAGELLVYRPALLGIAKLHFVQAAADVDTWQTVGRLAAMGNGLPDDVWAESDELDVDGLNFASEPAPDAHFAELPSALASPRSYTTWKNAFKNYLYRAGALVLHACPTLKQQSRLDESLAD